MGITAQQLLQSDPEFLQRQLAQQEMQRLNPTGSAAGALGALLGRGLSNVSSGRGFFDVNDAGLRRVAEVQRIMNSVEFDPKNPAGYYETIAKSLQSSGYGDLAPMALQEAVKFRQQERTEARQAKEISLRERQVLLEEVNKDPYGSITKALQMPEDDPTRATILAGASARIGEKNFDQAVKEAQIRASDAQTAKANQAEVSESVITEDGLPLQKRGGKFYTMDGKVYMGKVKKLATPGPYDAILGGGGTPGAATKPTGTPIYNPQTGKIEYKQ